MKIYINNLHQIKAVRENLTGDDTLQEIEVPDDFLQGFCDTVMCSFCYHMWQDEDGNDVLSVYPYKDFSLLESIQEQNDIRENQLNETVRNALDMDLRVTMLEMNVAAIKS